MENKTFFDDELAKSQREDEGVTPPIVPTGESKKALEQWGEQKGMLPRFSRTGSGSAPNPEYWKFAAVRAFKKWGMDHELTEGEFDAAVAEALGQSYR
jgi:hypothetical protein